MSNNVHPGLPKEYKKHPIDATGLFWAFVLAFYGLVSFGMCGPIVAAPFLIGAAFMVRWQFIKWSQDSVHNRGFQKSGKQLDKAALSPPSTAPSAPMQEENRA